MIAPSILSADFARLADEAAAVADAGVGTIADIARLQVDDVRRVGADVLVDARPLVGETPTEETPAGDTVQEGAV